MMTTFGEEETEVYNSLRRLEFVLNNRTESFTNKVESLIEVWKQVSQCRLTEHKQYVVHLMDWLKLHTLNIVLTGDWKKLKDTYEERLLKEVKHCEMLLLHSNNIFSLRCRKLAEVIKDPWGNPVLGRLLNNQEVKIGPEEIEFFGMETGYLISTRLRKLCESHCEDLALNLVTAFMRCHQLSEIQHFTINATEDQRRFILDVYIALLYKYKKTSLIISTLKSLTLTEGLDLLKRFAHKRVNISKIWRHSSRIAHLAAQVYVTAAVMKLPKESGHVLEGLLDTWLFLNESNDNWATLTTAVRRIIQAADSAIHMYIFCEAFYKKECYFQFGSFMKTFIIELYIRALTTDMNDLERQKNEDDAEKVAETSERLAYGFLRLADVLNEHLKVNRECVLTSFSLKPTQTTLDRIINLAKSSGYQVLDTGQTWKCKLHPPVDPSDEVCYKCDECGEFMSQLELKSPLNTNTALSEALTEEQLGLSPQLCDDLVVVLSSPRYQLFSWLVQWKDLHRLCVLYLNDPERTKNIVTELKFVDIDYSIFASVKREPEDEEVNGIERGYEHYLEDLYPEPTGSSDEAFHHEVTVNNDNVPESFHLLPPPVPKSDPKVLKSLRQFRPNLKRTNSKPNQKDWVIPPKVFVTSVPSSSSLLAIPTTMYSPCIDTRVINPAHYRNAAKLAKQTTCFSCPTNIQNTTNWQSYRSPNNTPNFIQDSRYQTTPPCTYATYSSVTGNTSPKDVALNLSMKDSSPAPMDLSKCTRSVDEIQKKLYVTQAVNNYLRNKNTLTNLPLSCKPVQRTYAKENSNRIKCDNIEKSETFQENCIENCVKDEHNDNSNIEMYDRSDTSTPTAIKVYPFCEIKNEEVNDGVIPIDLNSENSIQNNIDKSNCKEIDENGDNFNTTINLALENSELVKHESVDLTPKFECINEKEPIEELCDYEKLIDNEIAVNNEMKLMRTKKDLAIGDDSNISNIMCEEEESSKSPNFQMDHSDSDSPERLSKDDSAGNSNCEFGDVNLRTVPIFSISKSYFAIPTHFTFPNEVNSTELNPTADSEPETTNSSSLENSTKNPNPPSVTSQTDDKENVCNSSFLSIKSIKSDIEIGTSSIEYKTEAVSTIESDEEKSNNSQSVVDCRSNYVPTDCESNYVPTDCESNYVPSDCESNYVPTDCESNYVPTDSEDDLDFTPIPEENRRLEILSPSTDGETSDRPWETLSPSPEKEIKTEQMGERSSRVWETISPSPEKAILIEKVEEKSNRAWEITSPPREKEVLTEKLGVRSNTPWATISLSPQKEILAEKVEERSNRPWETISPSPDKEILAEKVEERSNIGWQTMLPSPKEEILSNKEEEISNKAWEMMSTSSKQEIIAKEAGVTANGEHELTRAFQVVSTDEGNNSETAQPAKEVIHELKEETLKEGFKFFEEDALDVLDTNSITKLDTDIEEESLNPPVLIKEEMCVPSMVVSNEIKNNENKIPNRGDICFLKGITLPYDNKIQNFEDDINIKALGEDIQSFKIRITKYSNTKLCDLSVQMNNGDDCEQVQDDVTDDMNCETIQSKNERKIFNYRKKTKKFTNSIDKSLIDVQEGVKSISILSPRKTKIKEKTKNELIDLSKKYKLKELRVVLYRLNWPDNSDKKDCVKCDEPRVYKQKSKSGPKKIVKKSENMTKEKSKTKTKIRKSKSETKPWPLQDISPKVNRYNDEKSIVVKQEKCSGDFKTDLNAMNPCVVLKRLEFDKDKKKSTNSVLAQIPGLNDLQMIRPSSVDRIVQVVQVPGARSTTNVPIPNTQTSTQVTPHIQRIGQPRTEKPVSSDSETVVTSTSPSSSTSSTSTTTESPTLINILSQQIIRPANQNNCVNLKPRTSPLINILSQQIIKPASTGSSTKVTSSSGTTDTQVNSIPRVISGGDQIISQLINQVRTPAPTLKTLVSAPGSEQNRILQFICKSSDGKLIPVTSFTSNKVVKVSMTQTVNASVAGTVGAEENNSKTAQNTFKTKSETNEGLDMLPKFQHAFGKPAYQNNVESGESTGSNSETTNTEGEKSSNVKNQPKNSPASLNVQPVQGGVIYTRQVPVGQTINLIPPGRGQVFRIATSNPEQLSLVKDSVIQGKMSALLAAALQGKQRTLENNEVDISSEDDSQASTRVTLTTHQPIVQNARIVKPVLQIPSNVIRSAPQSNLSSTTLEQLREFDMVYKQVKERSSTNVPTECSPQSDSNDTPQQISVTYLNQSQKINCAPVVVVSSYCNVQPAASPSLSVTSQGSSSPCVTPAPTLALSSKAPTKSPKAKTIKSTTTHTTKASPIPKPQQKPQEDEHTTQRIFDILAEYAEQLRNSPDLNNKPAPRRRSNPPTNPNQNAKRKKSSSTKKTGQSSNSLASDGDLDDTHTVGSEDSSCGVVQISVQDDEQPLATVNTSESSEASASPKQLILTDSTPNQSHSLIIADSNVGEALKMSNTAVLVPGNYIMPVSMVKGGQQIAVVSGGSKILATVPARSGPNMLLFQSFLNQTRKHGLPTVKYSTIQPISGIARNISGVTTQTSTNAPVTTTQNLTAVTLSSTMGLQKVNQFERVEVNNYDATEVFLAIPQAQETKTVSEHQQNEHSIITTSSITQTLQGDNDTSKPESSFDEERKEISKSSVATSVIAQNTISKEEPSEVQSSTPQTIMALNLNSSETDKDATIKVEGRVQSVLVATGTSNGPMLSHNPPTYNKQQVHSINSISESNKDEYLRNEGKVLRVLSHIDGQSLLFNQHIFSTVVAEDCIL